MRGPDFKWNNFSGLLQCWHCWCSLRGNHAPNTALILQTSAYCRVTAQQLVYGEWVSFPGERQTGDPGYPL